MTRSSLRRRRSPLRSVAAFAAALLLTACPSGDGATAPEPTAKEPWEVRMTMGNFAINTGSVTTNEDGVSLNHLTDYVSASSLPNVNFEVLTLNAYVPTRDGLSVRLSDIDVVVRRTDGSSTGDIYQSGEYVQTVTISGQRYAVFRMNGFHLGPPHITPANFANVNFTFTATYSTTSGGSPLSSRAVTLEVYKR